MVRDGIKIDGYLYTWYVIDERWRNGERLYLLENEVFGDEAPSIIVDGELNVILDDVWNGFADLDEIY